MELQQVNNKIESLKKNDIVKIYPQEDNTILLTGERSALNVIIRHMSDKTGCFGEFTSQNTLLLHTPPCSINEEFHYKWLHEAATVYLIKITYKTIY